MESDNPQQRRLIIAVLLTAMLVPGYFILRRAQSTPASADPNATTVPAETDEGDVLGTIPLGYLDGPTEDNDDDPPTIVVPESMDVLSTRATFDRNLPAIAACLVPGAPTDARVTIVNTDNGRSVACNNVINPDTFPDRAYPDDAILHITTYEAIADLTDAPVPVEASW